MAAKTDSAVPEAIQDALAAIMASDEAPLLDEGVGDGVEVSRQFGGQSDSGWKQWEAFCNRVESAEATLELTLSTKRTDG